MTYLERHRPEDNMHRFYTLQISRDLFGCWVLTRRWGRMGAQSGLSIITSYDCEAEATKELETVWDAKRKRGYHQLKGV